MRARNVTTKNFGVTVINEGRWTWSAWPISSIFRCMGDFIKEKRKFCGIIVDFPRIRVEIGKRTPFF